MPNVTDQERNLVKRMRADPVFVQEKILGTTPWAKQVEILESVRDNAVTGVASCHGMGKSHIAAGITLGFLFSFEPSIVITTAPSDRQVRGVLWKYIGTQHSNALMDLGGECLTQELKVRRDWFAWGFTAPEYDPDKFQGFHEENILVVVDEACGISARIFDGIDGVLSSGNARLLMIGNPTDPNTEFGRAMKRPNVNKIWVSAFETPNFTKFGITERDIIDGTWEAKIGGAELPIPQLVTPHWVADKWYKWGPDDPRYISRVLGRFPEASDDSLIPYRYVTQAVSHNAPGFGDPVYGADVARFGPDRCVLMRRKGGQLRVVDSFGKSDTMETARRFARTIRKDPGPVNIDSIGVGAGVFDKMIDMQEEGDLPDNIEIRGVEVGRAALDDENYYNRRAELAYMMRDAFENGELDIDPDDEDFIEELTAVQWRPDTKERVKLEPKDDTKDRLGRSPDKFDAAMLTFAGDMLLQAGVWGKSRR